MSELFDNIITILTDSNIELAYIFGSYSSGNYRDSSDVDIAVLNELDFNQKLDLISKLSKVTGRDIDLIELENVDISFQAEIVYTGKNIICKNHEQKEEYEMKLFSNYLTMEEDRAIIIKDIYNRGSVY